MYKTVANYALPRLKTNKKEEKGETAEDIKA